MTKLTLASRDANTNLDTVRAAGDIPAVFYGGGQDSTTVAVNEATFTKVRKEAGESTMITFDTEKGELQGLIHEVQEHPVSGKVLHVDFKMVEAGKPIQVTVPLEFVGEAPAVKNGLGTLTKALQELVIEVLPKDLPSHIDVAISGLTGLDSQLLVKDLALPNGVTVQLEDDEVVAAIAAVREEEEEAPAEEIDFSQIETTDQKGKKEEASSESGDAKESNES